MAVVERLDFQDLEGLRTGRFTSRLNTTCIAYRLGSTVIDTGPANQWHFVRRFLDEREIRRILVTHHHEDHSGNLATIKKRWHPELLAPAAGRSALAKGYEFHLYRRIIWGRPALVETAVLPETIEIEGGISLRALATPGHSVDSTCFLEPNRGWIFTGDLFVAARPRYLRHDENVQQYIASLKRVLEEDFQVVLCSHRGPLEDGRQRIERKLEYLESLCEQVHRLQEDGKSLRAITRLTLGREDSMLLMSRGHFSKRNLIASCLEA